MPPYRGFCPLYDRRVACNATNKTTRTKQYARVAGNRVKNYPHPLHHLVQHLSLFEATIY